MLHGCDQDAADFALGTGMNRLAEECGGIVLYPEQCRLINAFGCWNWHREEHQSADQGEPSLIAGMTRQVIASHGVDASRVYVAGMSAGGAMAVILGQEYPDLYAAVGVHSGVASGVVSDLRAAMNAMARGPSQIASAQSGRTRRRRRSVPTIVFHGDQDAVVHISNARAVHAQAREARPRRIAPNVAGSAHRSSKVRTPQGSQGHAFTRTAHTSDGVPHAEMRIIHGAGHAWTGGRPDGTHTDAHGPDASREMMRFFLQQRLAPALAARVRK